MHDLRLSEAYSRDSLTIELQSPELQRVASSFSFNHGQVKNSLAAITLIVAWQEELLNKFRGEPALDIDTLMLRGIDVLTQFSQKKSMFGAVEQLLATMIVSSWTSFEVLALDTWVAVLNLRPQRLALLRGRQSEQSRSSGDQLRTVPLKLLHDATRGTFDVKNHMGDILKEKFNFSRLSGIRDAYTSAFANDDSRVVEAVFDKSLDRVSTLRNAIIHNSRRADEEYLRRCKDTSLPEVALGKQIPLDGQLTGNLFESVWHCGVSLLTNIDNWVGIEISAS